MLFSLPVKSLHCAIKHLPRLVIITFACAVNFVPSQLARAATDPSQIKSISQENFIYTPREMLEFDIEAYLRKQAPQLLNQAESISHWSGRTTISPKIIITLLEHQSKLLSSKATNKDLEWALTHLSTEDDLSSRIGEVATVLAEAYYTNLADDNREPEHDALKSIIGDGEKSAKELTVDFINLFFSLFPQANLEQKSLTSQHTKNRPPIDLLQLPYPIGQAWQTWGGTHSFTGQNSGPRSSLDFRSNRGGFGSNTSNIWVSSASGGRAVKHSSCFVEVLASGGWSTTYYHLDNVQINTGQSVSRNMRLANYANNLSQSICDGGMSNGPHVHFSLKRNGIYVSLDKVKLSGYEVQDGRRDYDSNCNFFWLDDSGTKFCNGTPIPNRGVVVQPTTRPDLTVSNIVLSKQEFKIDEQFSASVLLENIGDADSSGSEVTFLFSTDASISSTDTPLTSLFTMPLSPGASTSYSASEFSIGIAGEFWFGACVASVVGESNTANNCSVGIPVTVVKNKPLLIPSILLLLDKQDEP